MKTPKILTALVVGVYGIGFSLWLGCVPETKGVARSSLSPHEELGGGPTTSLPGTTQPLQAGKGERGADQGGQAASSKADGDKASGQAPSRSPRGEGDASIWKSLVGDDGMGGYSSPIMGEEDRYQDAHSVGGSSRKGRAGLPRTTRALSTEQIFETTMDYIQASNEYWEKGDVENANDALDQAYSLLLKVDPDAGPETLQQRDDLRITVAKRIIEIHTSQFTVANGFANAIPLDMNRHVEQALAQFKGPERNFFLNAYRRSGIYRPAIIAALKEAGMPEEISWLPLIESGFKPRAQSPARALGMWQFIATTGYKYGLNRDNWVDERMDVEKSTLAAIAYLKELHRMFGDWSTSLAAYNCGEYRVLKCIQTQKINYLDHFWDLYEKLPQETAFYFPRFLAVLHILKDPAAHGFELPPADMPLEWDEVTVDRSLPFRSLADALDVPPEALQALNPELRQDVTPNVSYALRVPKGKGETLTAKLPTLSDWTPVVTASAPSDSPTRTHKVKKGETLYSISKKYKTSQDGLKEANKLKKGEAVRVGMVLKIPAQKPAAAAKAPAAPPAPEKKKELQDYTVEKGDSLLKIAQKFGTTIGAIKTTNRLKGAQLAVGQVLKIPADASAASKAKTRKYVTLKGENPTSIAQKHQMTLPEFLRMNGLTPRSTLLPGQVVLVKAR